VDSYFELMVRYTGAVVALVASFLAAPEATRHLWDQFRGAAAVSRRSVTATFRPVLDRLRGHGRAKGSTVQGSGQASLGFTASATVTGRLGFPVDTEAPLAERVKRVEQYIQTLSELHEANKQAIAQEKASLAAMVRTVEHKIEQEAGAIHRRLDEMEQTAMLVDAQHCRSSVSVS